MQSLAIFWIFLESMGLEQHIAGPTHNLGHTLDLIITRQPDSIIKNNPTIGQFFYDHAAVLCDLNSTKPEVSKLSPTGTSSQLTLNLLKEVLLNQPCVMKTLSI